jgi:hypothetical protein
LIDGHNLAHHLFMLPAGQRLGSEIAAQLVTLLSKYRDQFSGSRPEFEVCFDGGVRPDIPDPPGIRVLAAGHQNKADYLVVDRFRTHAYFGHDCLVITNDEEILTRVEIEGGATLRVYDFVRKQHPDSPEFQSPEVLERELFRRSRKEKLRIPEPELFLHRTSPIKPSYRKSKAVIQPVRPSETSPINVQISAELDVQILPQQPKPEFFYRITFSTWPVPEGVHFLMDSFCDKHRPEFINLLNSFDPEDLRPADLQVLAEFLVAECGDEAGFCTRGSLMNRVRLALLKADASGLSLSQLAQATGLKPLGLQGRIRGKSKGWLEVLFPV